MTDFITSRGSLHYIFIWVFLWYAIDYGQRWFFNAFKIESDGWRFLTMIIIFIAILACTLIIPEKKKFKKKYM